MSEEGYRDLGTGTRDSGGSGPDSEAETRQLNLPTQDAAPLSQRGVGGDLRDLRLRYLQAMGIDVWVPRTTGTREIGASAVSDAASISPRISLERSSARRHDELSSGPSPSAIVDTRFPSPESRVPLQEIQVPSPAGGDVAQLDWNALKRRVAACTLCDLHRTRTQTVFGVGSQTAAWLFIGEAPGRDEDAQGEPFVGRAGQLLNNMLRAIGFSREQVYIANILKCRPPKNRDPKPEEARACEPYLKRQIAMLRPKVIIALGRIAAQNLLHTDTPIGKMRGKQYVYADTGIPLLVTYHPAYLLRSPGEKRKAWQDLLLAQKMVRAV